MDFELSRFFSEAHWWSFCFLRATWLAEKKKKGTTGRWNVPLWKVKHQPAQLESAPTTTGLWNYHKHDERGKKEKENAYFTASISRVRNVNFTNKLLSRFCRPEIGALVFVWFVCRDGKQITKLPALEKKVTWGRQLENTPAAWWRQQRRGSEEGRCEGVFGRAWGCQSELKENRGWWIHKFSLSSLRALWNKLWTTGRLKLTKQLQLNAHMDFYFPFWGFFNTVVFSSCSKTYSLHGHLSVRSGSQRGQVWLSARCGDSGKLSLSSWIIPAGATVHSHCEMGLIAQRRVEKGGKKRNGRRWPPKRQIGFWIFAKLDGEHTYSLW